MKLLKQRKILQTRPAARPLQVRRPGASFTSSLVSLQNQHPVTSLKPHHDCRYFQIPNNKPLLTQRPQIAHHSSIQTRLLPQKTMGRHYSSSPLPNGSSQHSQIRSYSDERIMQDQRFQEDQEIVEHWKSQPKRFQESDLITDSQLRAMYSTTCPPLKPPYEYVPNSWHLIFANPHTTEADLSPDGYEASFCPPEPWVQRMWAGSSLKFRPENPLKRGQEIRLTAQLQNVELKRARSGNSMVFVDELREISNQFGPSIVDVRKLVYMKQRPPASLPIQPPETTFPSFSFPVTPVLLFRYSALTFNSHRIHFDHNYCVQQENYPAPLVHGPLTATLLLHYVLMEYCWKYSDEDKTLAYDKADKIFKAFRTQQPDENRLFLEKSGSGGYELLEWNYRAVRPLFLEDNGIVIKMGRAKPEKDSSTGHLKVSVWATGPDGSIAMKGQAVLADQQ